MQSHTFLCSCHSRTFVPWLWVRNVKFPPKWHRQSTKWYIHAHSGEPALTSMKSGLSHWQDIAQFALKRASTPPWCGGKAAQVGVVLAGHSEHPWFCQEPWQRAQDLLTCPCIIPGPSSMRVKVLLLSGSLPTHRELKSSSLPHFSLGEQLPGEHSAVQYRVSFWARLLTNKVIKLMAGTFPKSLRAVAATSMLGTVSQCVSQNIKKQAPFKIPLWRCLRSP